MNKKGIDEFKNIINEISKLLKEKVEKSKAKIPDEFGDMKASKNYVNELSIMKKVYKEI